MKEEKRHLGNEQNKTKHSAVFCPTYNCTVRPGSRISPLLRVLPHSIYKTTAAWNWLAHRNKHHACAPPTLPLTHRRRGHIATPREHRYMATPRPPTATLHILQPNNQWSRKWQKRSSFNQVTPAIHRPARPTTRRYWPATETIIITKQR